MKTYKLKDIISQGTKDLFYIWWQELKAVVKDQGVLIFFILVPLGYPLLYTFIYTNETVREVPAAVVDNNRSSLSREYLRLVDAGADLEIVSHCSDMEEAKTLLKNGKVYGIIYIPESFSRDITKGVQTHVTIYCDMSGMLYYKAMLTANTNASLVMNKQIKIERSGNTTIRQDEVSTSPIAYEDISIFNPQNGFANRFRDLIPMSRHYHGTLRIVLGKSLTYLMIYAVMATYMLCLVPKMFSLVQIAQAGTLAAFMFPYILACIFFAMTCSIFIHHREACMMIYVFTSVPLLFISGISWPGTAIPKFWEVVSWLFPSTFGINGFVRINNMGATLTDVLTEYRVLWIQTGVYFLTTCIVYRRQITLSRRHVYERLKEIKKRRRTNVV